MRIFRENKGTKKLHKELQALYLLILSIGIIRNLGSKKILRNFTEFSESLLIMSQNESFDHKASFWAKIFIYYLPLSNVCVQNNSFNNIKMELGWLYILFEHQEQTWEFYTYHF